MEDRRFVAIDLKSFYASVECVERGLDPLDAFVKEYEPTVAIKLISGNVGFAGKKLSIPHFLAMFL